MRVLYVCIGNLCRSVFAERLTRHELAARLGPDAARFHVSSAGTRGLDGQPMHPYTAQVLSSWQVDPGGFTARRLAPALLADADLVLTATGAERDEAVAMAPAALRRTFTLNEFARLAAHLPDRPGDVVAAVSALRGRIRLTDPAGDDIPDPDRTPAAFRQCGERIAGAVRATVAVLGGGAGGPSAARADDRVNLGRLDSVSLSTDDA